MKPAVVCVSGGIGSGKTEVSMRLAKRLAWRRASFGDYVRAVASERGIPAEREQLQQLGESLIEADVDRFCIAVVKVAGWTEGEPLVVDGVRHAEALHAIRDLVAPLVASLVYLAAPEEMRAARLAGARPADGAKLCQLERHSTEVQVSTTLAEIADLTLHASAAPDDLVDAICDWLARR